MLNLLEGCLWYLLFSFLSGLFLVHSIILTLYWSSSLIPHVHPIMAYFAKFKKKKKNPHIHMYIIHTDMQSTWYMYYLINLVFSSREINELDLSLSLENPLFECCCSQSQISIIQSRPLLLQTLHFWRGLGQCVTGTPPLPWMSPAGLSDSPSSTPSSRWRPWVPQTPATCLACTPHSHWDFPS